MPGSGNCSGMWSSWCHSLYARCSFGAVISVNEKKPTTTLLDFTTPIALFDRDGVHRRTGAAHDRLGRRLEEELVHAVVGAVGGERLEHEVLALGHPHVDEVQQVYGERAVLALGREDLVRVAVGGDRGD